MWMPNVLFCPLDKGGGELFVSPDCSHYYNTSCTSTGGLRDGQRWAPPRVPPARHLPNLHRAAHHPADALRLPAGLRQREQGQYRLPVPAQLVCADRQGKREPSRRHQGARPGLFLNTRWTRLATTALRIPGSSFWGIMIKPKVTWVFLQSKSSFFDLPPRERTVHPAFQLFRNTVEWYDSLEDDDKSTFRSTFTSLIVSVQVMFRLVKKKKKGALLLCNHVYFTACFDKRGWTTWRSAT